MLYGIGLFFFTIIMCFIMSALNGDYNDHFEMERKLAKHRREKNHE